MKPRFEEYPIMIRPLTLAEGGGFLATFPDLPGCLADGETPEEALNDARSAFDCWIAAHIADGRPIPTFNALKKNTDRILSFFHLPDTRYTFRNKPSLMLF